MELQVGLVAPSPGSSSGSSALSVLGSGSWKRPGRGDMVSALPGVTLKGFSLFPVLPFETRGNSFQGRAVVTGSCEAQVSYFSERGILCPPAHVALLTFSSSSPGLGPMFMPTVTFHKIGLLSLHL